VGPNAEDHDAEEDEFEEDLDLLRSFSLVTTNISGDMLEMHQLAQFATRTWLRSFGGGTGRGRYW
jgi:hypothetical protein